MFVLIVWKQNKKQNKTNQEQKKHIPKQNQHKNRKAET